MTNTNQTVINGRVKATTENSIGKQIAREKNDKVHSAPEPVTGNTATTKLTLKDLFKKTSPGYQTFGTRFRFPETTTEATSEAPSRVDMEELERELLEVLDRLAQSYTHQPIIN